MSVLAEHFITALHRLEPERDVEVITGLFSEDATLRRATRRRTYSGREGARQFWSEYLDAFTQIETQFGAITESEGRVVLEWHSTATDKRGQQVEYDGCTIVEGDGTVRGFRTYYDAASAGMAGAVGADRQT
jgi:hypothetical protein